MPESVSQSECRKEWEAVKKQFLERITTIDNKTPAVPIEEPTWWLEMMHIQRYIRDLKIQR